MTAEAVEKAGQLFDEISARKLGETEALLRSKHVDPEEIAHELARLKAEHDAERWSLLCRIRVSLQNEALVCAEPSKQVH